MGLLERLLSTDGIKMLVQPIFRSRGLLAAPEAYEFLARGPCGTNIEPANILFDYVRRKRADVVVDRRCLEVALSQAAGLPASSRININVNCSTLERAPDFASQVAAIAGRYGIAVERITLEIVETSYSWDSSVLGPALQRFRDLGVRFAADDFGSGCSNQRMMLDCRPEYLKLDSYIVQRAATDPCRAAMLRNTVQLADSLNCEVVAEGIETVADLNAVRLAGISLFQGYLLGRPQPVSDVMADGAEKGFTIRDCPNLEQLIQA